MMLAADNMLQGMGMVVMVLAGTTVMLMMLRRHQFRRVTGRDVTRAQFARLRDQTEVRNSMDTLLLQLEQLQREINAQLDTKFTRLETVIHDADQRIAQLQRLQAGEAALDAAAPEPGTPSAAVPDRGPEPVEAAPDPPRPASRAPKTEEQRRVFELHDAGNTPVQVAEALGLPLGEVQVMLQLREF